MSPFRTALHAAVVLSLFAHGVPAAWQMKRGPLMTRWAGQVDPGNVLGEYPRPQLTRPDWQNLNGVWQYQPGREGDATPAGRTLSGQILVPFCAESAVSGVMEHSDRMWYRRTFAVPAAWKGRRTVLHFGAVDFEAEVFVNGKSLGVHRGGYDPFRFDVTDALRADGEQELVVRAFDPTNKGGQPRGKQSLRPGGITYTSCSGIWQSVWMEPVAAGGVASLKIVPDVDGGQVKVTVNPMGDAGGSTVTVRARDGNADVAAVEGKPGQELLLKVPDAKLWSPGSPHLYDLAVTVERDGKAVDAVGSYFGMRKIEVAAGPDGVKRMMLNGEFAFQLGPLDQGFWPDGIYTAPTDEALRYDVEAAKQMGFNFIRKHIKVEPLRWYYWCDRLGLMVWQDMPSANTYDRQSPPPVDKPQFKLELTKMIENLYNVPSIVMWVVFNEGQGQHDTKELVPYVHQLDPSRLVNQASGGGHEGVGDVFDIHLYPAPQAPAPQKNQALAVGEYGGINLRVEGHLWRSGRGPTYVMSESPAELVDLYSEYTALLKTFRDKNGLSAAVYTQITDVEKELNGLLTYDRVPKADFKEIARANRFERAGPTYRPLLATSEQQSQAWKYTFDKPADDWAKPGFDAAGWREGPGGFGTKDTPAIGQLGTVWDGENVWLRRTFKPGNLKPDEMKKLLLRVYHDEDVEVFINGVSALNEKGRRGYQNRLINPAARAAIRPDADNVLAVHCRQTTGGQYVDVGLVLREPSEP